MAQATLSLLHSSCLLSDRLGHSAQYLPHEETEGRSYARPTAHG